jgi:hypothetical protein
MARNFSAFLTTDIIIRPTSCVIKCAQIDRYYDMPTRKKVIKLTGQTVSILKHDVLRGAIDTNVITNINSVTHFQGILDGLDVLSAKPEYIDFNENGKTFVALNKPPQPLSPHTCWEQIKWYFYAPGLGLFGLILLFSSCLLCTCTNCC